MDKFTVFQSTCAFQIDQVQLKLFNQKLFAALGVEWPISFNYVPVAV